MAGIRKKNQGNFIVISPVTPKKRSKRRRGHKSPCLAITSPRVAQAILAADEESQECLPTLKTPSPTKEVPEIMDMLMAISSWLQETELFMQEAHKDKEAVAARDSPSSRRVAAAPRRSPNLRYGWSITHSIREQPAISSLQSQPPLLRMAQSWTELSEAVRKNHQVTASGPHPGNHQLRQ